MSKHLIATGSGVNSSGENYSYKIFEYLDKTPVVYEILLGLPNKMVRTRNIAGMNEVRGCRCYDDYIILHCLEKDYNTIVEWKRYKAIYYDVLKHIPKW